MTLTFVPLITKDKAVTLAVRYAAVTRSDGAFQSDDLKTVEMAIFWRKGLLDLQRELALEITRNDHIAEMIGVLERRAARLRATDLTIPPAPAAAPNLTLVKA